MPLRLKVNKGIFSPWLFDQPAWVRAIIPILVFLLVSGAYFLSQNDPRVAHFYALPIIVAAATNGYLGMALAVLVSGIITVFVNPALDPDWFIDLSVFLTGGVIAAFLFSLAWQSLQRARDLNLLATERAHELESLRELDRVILGSGELEHMLVVVFQALASLGGAVAAAYFRLDEEKGLLIPEASAGIPLETIRDYLSRVGWVRLGEMGVGWAVLQGTTTVVRDTRSDPRYARFSDAPGLFGFAVSVAAPVTHRGKTYGGLAVTFSPGKEITEDDTRIVAIMANQMAIGLQSMEQRQQLHDLTYQAMAALGEAIEARDPYTGGHCQRLAEHSVAIAQEMGFPREVQDRVRFAAYLHDVGKVGVPDSILKKPGPLTPQEYAEIKQHPYIGSQLVKRMPMLADVADIVYHHHEHYDGSGYPDGVRGARIPIEARIIAVADALDAMTNDRPYRQARDGEAACQELIRGKGTQFDPQMVDAFLRVIEKGSGVA